MSKVWVTDLRSSIEKVVCVNNDDVSLTIGKIYDVSTLLYDTSMYSVYNDTGLVSILSKNSATGATGNNGSNGSRNWKIFVMKN